MSTRTVRKDGPASSRGTLVRGLRLHIRCRPHTSGTLARKLGVSVATMDRALVDLRRDLAKVGLSLVNVKEGKEWHYEIREKEDVWNTDPLLRAVGSVKGARRLAGESVDDALYGKGKSKQ